MHEEETSPVSRVRLRSMLYSVRPKYTAGADLASSPSARPSSLVLALSSSARTWICWASVSCASDGGGPGVLDQVPDFWLSWHITVLCSSASLLAPVAPDRGGIWSGPKLAALVGSAAPGVPGQSGTARLTTRTDGILRGAGQASGRGPQVLPRCRTGAAGAGPGAVCTSGPMRPSIRNKFTLEVLNHSQPDARRYSCFFAGCAGAGLPGSRPGMYLNCAVRADRLARCGSTIVVAW
jgi:hypothetical protein